MHLCALYESQKKWRLLRLKNVTAGRIKGWIEVAGRRGRRRKKLLDDPQEKRGHWMLKEEALDHTLWKRQWACRKTLRSD